MKALLTSLLSSDAFLYRKPTRPKTVRTAPKKQ
jgi:hypothetical protein